MLEVAVHHRRQADLISGLNRIVVAAVGPVVARELEAIAVFHPIVPADNFNMKPLVNALARALLAE
jgi:uroporphyrinogen-III synthase